MYLLEVDFIDMDIWFQRIINNRMNGLGFNNLPVSNWMFYWHRNGEWYWIWLLENKYIDVSAWWFILFLQIHLQFHYIFYYNRGKL